MMALPNSPTMTDAIQTLQTNLFQDGFDICHSFHPQSYNDHLDTEGVKDLLRLGGNAAILIGNTKHLWPYFVDWCKKEKSELPKHPLDVYTQECIQKHAATAFGEKEQPFEIHLSSSFEREKLVGMQRIAALSGFAHVDSKLLLSIHPIYGPWHSYRAVICYYDTVVNDSPNQQQQQQVRLLPRQSSPTIPCPMSSDERDGAIEVMEYALEVSQGCDYNRMPLEIAQAWIAVRDCCKVGRVDYRFGHNQMLYHYTKDKSYIVHDNSTTATDSI